MKKRSTVSKGLDIKLTTKYKNFLISNYIIVGFLILVVLASNYLLVALFGFSQILFFPITLCLVFGGLLLYRYLSDSIFEEFFVSDKEIDGMIKKTLHELNTPVATIKMNTQMIARSITNDKDTKRIRRIDEACDSLLELYNHMEYEIASKIDVVPKQLFDIRDLVIESLGKIDDIKGDIEIIHSVTSETLFGDSYGFGIVIDNLLSNAIKYNKKDGKIFVTNSNHILKIEDTGVGISTKNMFLVFDKYFQIDTTQKGVGLGLAIVQEYCNKNGIIIKIDSQEKKRSIFALDYKNLIQEGDKSSQLINL